MEPARAMEVGETMKVAGSGTSQYTLKRHANHYSCTCPAWTFYGGESNLRTCKHLKAVLGEEFEAARVPPRSPSSRGKGKKASGGSKRARPAGGFDDDFSSPTQSPSSSASKRAKSSEAFKNITKDSAAPALGEEGKGPIEVMLAKTWELDGRASPQGLWAAEKIDGVRAYWDGENMWSRNRNKYEPPTWWKERLPKDTPLDGELFAGRDSFDRCSGLVRSGPGPHWKSIHYLVFDAVMDGKVEERWKVAKAKCADGQMSPDEVLKSITSCIAFLPQTEVKSKEHLLELLAEVHKVGGEGLMLRRPESRYTGGKTSDLYKVKTWYDAEGIVVGYNIGEGRNSHRTGSLRLLMECGQEFDCGGGLTDALREHPPPIGTVVVYKFQELSHEGTPRFPIYCGVSADKSVAKDAIVRSTQLRADQAAGGVSEA